MDERSLDIRTLLLLPEQHSNTLSSPSAAGGACPADRRSTGPPGQREERGGTEGRDPGPAGGKAGGGPPGGDSALRTDAAGRWGESSPLQAEPDAYG